MGYIEEMIQFNKSYIICVILSLSWVWGDCEEGEVELWDECYNVEETTELNLGWSGLTGQIPPEIGNLTNLIYLYLGGNELTGQIPSEIGNLINLTWLNLGNNQMTGEIPSEIGNLTNLEGLYLDYNEFTGQIPPEIGNLFDLINLNLGNNLLTGDIPSEIGTLTNLILLYLGWNELTGQIPSEIGNLTNLTGLGLLSNQLTGEIPTEIGNLINLVDLSLNNNHLTGDIPSEIGNLTNLFFLGLHFNQLTGDIPLEIWTLTNLNELNLSYNQLTGNIPSEIGNLTILGFLNLSSNQLTGDIPEEICNQGDTSSSLSNNQLCPPYPECLTEEDIGYQDTTNCSQDNITVDYQSDWNLVGSPLEVDNNLYNNLFPDAVEGTLYSFSGGYNLETHLIQGKGYWLRFIEAGSTTISGIPINELTISLNEGWNLISGISTPLDITEIQDPDGIIITGTIYGFASGGYSNAEILEPGNGYWIRANSSGSIILTSD